MRLPATVKWIGLALLGLAIAAAVAIAASNLASQQIGIASESISAGDALAPAIGATKRRSRLRLQRSRKHRANHHPRRSDDDADHHPAARGRPHRTHRTPHRTHRTERTRGRAQRQRWPRGLRRLVMLR